MIIYTAIRIKGKTNTFIQPFFNQKNLYQLKIMKQFWAKINKYFNNLYVKDSVKNKLLKLWQNNKNINNFLRDFFHLAVKDEIDK